MKHTAILSFPAAHPWRTIAGVALTVVIAIAGIAAVGLKTDNSIDVFLVEGDADYERFEDFRQRFGSNEILLLAVQDPQLLTTAGLERLDGLEAGLRAIDAQLVAAGTVKQAVIGTIRGPHSFPVVRELVAEGDTDALKRLPIVSGTFLVQNDHAPIGMLLTVLRSPLNGPDRTAFVGEVDTWLADQESPGTKIWAAGSPILNVNLDRASRGQSRTLFPFLFLVALVVLWVLSRSVRAALAMAATTIVTVPSAVCLLAVTGHSMNMITTTMPAVLMVLCFAASLHLYRAFADEDPAAVSDRVAADRARRHVMRPCFLASVATALGFLSLAISDLGPIRQMGVFCACGIAVSFLAAMTLLPALFALGAVPRRARKPGVEGATPCPLPPQRPSRVLPVTLVVFAICGVGLTRLDIESAAIRFLRRDHPVVQAWDHIQGSGAGIAPIEIMLRVPDATILEDPTTLAKIAAAVRDARAVEMISDAWSVPATLTLLDAELSAILAQDPRRASALAPMREQALAAVPAETPPAVRAGVALAPLLGALSGRTDPPPLIAGLPADALNGARGLVRTALSRSGAGAVVRIHLATVATEVSDFRQVMDDIDVVTQRLEASVPGSRVETTGLGPMLIRMQSYLIESQIKSLAGAGVLVMLILLIGLRSIRLALVGAVPNIAPLIVVFGVLGWLGVNLDVATVMVGAIALGIAVDDTTHVLSTYDRRLRRPVATRKALDHVWWPVLSTSLMSTAGFSVLAFSDFAPMMKFGIVTASAMALANLGDLVLLPALLLWFGPRPDRAEFVRISGAGGLLDRVLRRRRGGRLLLELGFSAWRAAERTLDDDPRGAGDLYR
ncbi:MAG: hypothetical protein CMJ84_00605, partial [Planctomycetes bacterium]|nr:hypothetical protein [Planctomycetota bacterium]